MSDTSPKNQEALRHDAPRTPARRPQPGEKLFEFLRGHDRFRCELRDHGRYGIEAQFFQNEEFVFSRRFDPSLDPTRTPREWPTNSEHGRRSVLASGGRRANVPCHRSVSADCQRVRHRPPMFKSWTRANR